VRWILCCALLVWARPCGAQGLGLRARFDLDPLHALATEGPALHAIAIRVEGLTPAALQLLERTRHAGDSLVLVPGGIYWELWTTSDRFVDWLTEYEALARTELGARRPVVRWRSLAVCVVSSGKSGPLMAEASIRLLSRIDDGGKRAELRGPERRWLRPLVEGVRSQHNVVPWQRVQQAMLKVTAALEATRIDPNQRDRVAEGVRGGVRVLGWLELGGGYRRLPAEIKGGDRQGEVTWSSVVFARAGIHLGRRWGQKLTFPLLLDLGGGASVAFHLRVHSGMRIQLSPALYLGLRPIEPTYTVYEDDPAIPTDSGWDMRSSAEILAEF